MGLDVIKNILITFLAIDCYIFNIFNIINRLQISVLKISQENMLKLVLFTINS